MSEAYQRMKAMGQEAKPDKTPSLEVQEAQAWLARNPGKDLADFMMFKAKMVPAYNFSLQGGARNEARSDRSFQYHNKELDSLHIGCRPRGKTTTPHTSRGGLRNRVRMPQGTQRGGRQVQVTFAIEQGAKAHETQGITSHHCDLDTRFFGGSRFHFNLSRLRLG